MMKKVVCAAVVLLAGVVPARADVRLSMHDGLVTISARDATVRQILAEWARVGHATIVNADRIAGGPVTLEITDVPEKQALDILLRSISGYLAAPRATMEPGTSRFDRILVLPSAVQPRSQSSTSAAPAPLPQPRPFQLQPAPAELEDGPTPNVSEIPQRPAANQFAPAPSQPVPAASGPTPTFNAPVAPAGTSAPGMILQPTPQPGQQPGQPVRF